LSPRLDAKKAFIISLACIILLAVGLGILFYASTLGVVTPRAGKNVVGVVRVEGPILSPLEAGRCINAISRAAANETVKAVVLAVDSPGGYADLIEQIYLDLLELKRRKPLVASVASALSGGYYIAVAADYIYVCPTSMVGNVGVIGVAPPSLVPSEWVLETGAYKATGFSKLLFPLNLSHALDSFVSAVAEGRGERLKLSAAQLKRGLIYLGSEAVAVGLADEVGSLQRAVRRAAQEAGLVEYEVVDLTQAGEGSAKSTGSYGRSTPEWRNLTMEALNELHPPPATYYLYLPPQSLAQRPPSAEAWAQGQAAAPSFGAGGRGLVLVDLSHGNRVSWWELDALIAELVKRNLTVRFASRWSEVKDALRDASALIVASPTTPYSTEECEAVEGFVNDGKLLLLFFDPAWEWVEVPALSWPINSLASRFGLYFAKGYLYSERESYGMYRNIYVREFADSPLTRNLTSLVFFTATYIHCQDKGVAWTPEDTYSSEAEGAGRYPVIALARGKGMVAAFGDLTFLKEPFCRLEDNYKLVVNIASAVAEVKAKAEQRG
jgi:protease-4